MAAKEGLTHKVHKGSCITQQSSKGRVIPNMAVFKGGPHHNSYTATVAKGSRTIQPHHNHRQEAAPHSRQGERPLQQSPYNSKEKGRSNSHPTAARREPHHTTTDLKGGAAATSEKLLKEGRSNNRKLQQQM